ncbi:N-acetyltransferase [Aromatoleum toluvorans]|uniref:N-acetyltransferase n=1 Tax=Aromatoleum toluvorans TaxID=92002 RepID=A0ABX1Q5S0_9RHOO|nr:N-acetyltransferase [Aromatoleum toluvorans]NMG45860.1 N-acetyltransferase [Aromatoleum toluvorans]
MSAAALGLPCWRARPLELRIDVQQSPEALDIELDTLYRRLNSPGDALHGLPATESGAPGLVFRCREADGEFYVFVEDVIERRLAGYTVFNRLVELNRRAEKHVRAPHSKYAPAYQRRGIATAVYESALQSGLCLISGARQSAAAHALWHALAQRHELGYVDIGDKSLRYLGRRVNGAILDALHIRMVLLGRGWTVESLCGGAA